MAPVAGAPPAHVDIFDLIVDPVTSAVGGAADALPLVDPLMGTNPLAGLDLAGLAGTGGLDLGSVDAAPAVPADPLAGLGSAVADGFQVTAASVAPAPSATSTAVPAATAASPAPAVPEAPAPAPV